MYRAAHRFMIWTMDELVIGDLFDPEDIVDQWVFSLAATAADLAAAESVFKAHLDRDEPAVRTQYFYRQLVARLYESERVVIVATENDDVGAFLATIPGSDQPLDALAADFLPVEASAVRAKLGYSRHRTVHHAFVGSDELQVDLTGALNQPARVLIDHANERVLHEFPEAVLSHALTPDLQTEQGREELRERVRFVGRLMANFGTLLTSVLAAQLDRKEIDPAALYHEASENRTRTVAEQESE